MGCVGVVGCVAAWDGVKEGAVSWPGRRCSVVHGEGQLLGREGGSEEEEPR